MKTSAGILLYRKIDQLLQVFLVHPGGPVWEQKDLGAWSIPKGEFTTEEDPFTAAIREFQEETGVSLKGDFVALTPVRQSSVKTVYAWALQGDIDAASIRSNTFSMQWPPKSGSYQEFPEVDCGEWFDLDTARRKIVKGQLALLEELAAIVKSPSFPLC